MEDFDGGGLELAAQMNRAEHIARAEARALEYVHRAERGTTVAYRDNLPSILIYLGSGAWAESGHEHMRLLQRW
jgi:hypothetical protein